MAQSKSTSKKTAAKVASKSTAKTETKKAASKVGRQAIDYSKMDTPYREDTSQGIVFDLIRSGKTKKADLKAKSLEALKASKKTSRNIGALIRATINDATQRGWKITLKGEYLTVSH